MTGTFRRSDKLIARNAKRSVVKACSWCRNPDPSQPIDAFHPEAIRSAMLRSIGRELAGEMGFSGGGQLCPVPPFYREETSVFMSREALSCD